MFRVKFDATLEQMLVALREFEIAGFYFICASRTSKTGYKSFKDIQRKSYIKNRA